MQKQPGNSVLSSVPKSSALPREKLLSFLERHLIRIVLFGCLIAIGGSLFLTIRHIQSATIFSDSQSVQSQTDHSDDDAVKLHQAKVSLGELDLTNISDPFQRSEP